MLNDKDVELIYCDMRRCSDYHRVYNVNTSLKGRELIKEINEWGLKHGYQPYRESCHPLCDRITRITPESDGVRVTVFCPYKD